jgi:hypothetical protein
MHGVEASEMEGVDLFYNVVLEDRAKPHLSGEYYFLLQHPFERVIPKPPPISQKTAAIIEILIRATNVLIPLFFQPTQDPLTGDDENAESESDNQEEDAKTGDGKPGGVESSGKKSSWQLNQERFSKRLDEYQLESFRVVSMVVHSSHLQLLLRSVIVYYPGFNLKGNRIEVPFPFEPLMHYYNNLVALKVGGESDKLEEEHLSEINKSGETKAQTQSKELDEETLHALDVLLAYLKPTYSSFIQPEESRYQEGLASFRFLWFLFKPGSDVYARVDGKLAAFVVEEVAESVSKGRSDIIVKCWSLAYKARRVMKVRSQYTIYDFIGEREILSLPVFPCMYLDKTDKGKTKANLETLGEKYYEILKEVPAYRAYSGYTWGKRRKTVKSGKRSEERTHVWLKPDN